MGKTFYFIGGSTGTGLSLARKLIHEGHSVHLMARAENETGRLEGVTFSPLQITDESPLFYPAEGPVDGLVYFPGTINLKPFRSISNHDFETDWQIHFLGAVKALRFYGEALKKSGNASVVLFSTVAVQTGMPFHTSVAAAKGAVEGFARALAAEWAPSVRVNVIAPSLTDTPLAEKLLKGDERRKAAADRHPLKRFGQPEDLADAARFLLSEESSWITGQIIHVDGGMSSLKVS
jgi:NAD(P)-dependent dehydrogenase (short-subunit alcohol dehydrogenase family)